jgi:hypothetical protein
MKERVKKMTYRKMVNQQKDLEVKIERARIESLVKVSNAINSLDSEDCVHIVDVSIAVARQLRQTGICNDIIFIKMMKEHNITFNELEAWAHFDGWFLDNIHILPSELE